MGNYSRKWGEESDLEEAPRRGFSKEEDRAFYRGRRYERRRIFKIALWCIAGLIVVVKVVNFLQRCVIFVPMR